MRRMLLLVALLAPAVAVAVPARVRVFEAEAHASPSEAAPVVHAFPEAATVSVSEEIEAGWRKVRLPDGSVAYVRDADVIVSTPATEASPLAGPSVTAPADGPATASPDLRFAPPANGASAPRARIYVKDLAHFSELVQGDPVVSPKAQALANRWTGAKATWIGSGIAAAALLALAIADPFPKPCEPPLFPGASPLCDPFSPKVLPLAFSSVGVALVGTGAGWLVAPKRDDLIDAVNAWNTRHPDEPFDLGDHASHRGWR